jgi:phosphoadenosine phosphosulfate reductase
MGRLDQHSKIALSFSGGRDSLACVHLLREYLDRITIYHNDTGDMLPETRELVAEVEAFSPHFVRIETDVAGWIHDNGLPSDLLTFSAHPLGLLFGDRKTRLVHRYDCCFANRMAPLLERIVADGNTLLIRGTRRSDVPMLPAEDGNRGALLELYLPLQEWSAADVDGFLASKGVKLPRVYQYMPHSPDCARCPAWWSEQRGAYLREFHPDLWRDYDARLQLIINEVAPSLAALRREAGVT